MAIRTLSGDKVVRVGGVQGRGPDRRARRRRSPDAAVEEILEAAEQVYRERLGEGVTVSAIMDRTTLSRKAFYVYFRSLDELIVRLVARIRNEADAAIARYVAEDSDIVADGKTTLRAVAELYHRHGPLIRALAESSRADPEAKRAWQSFTDPVKAAIAERLRAEARAERISGIDVDATVAALIGMNIAAFFENLIDREDPDLDGLVETLHTIWIRVFYGTEPPVDAGVGRERASVSAPQRAPS